MREMIVAHGMNYEIGANNKLLWNLPSDLKYFKEKTLGKVVVMGKSTFQSIGKALPDRTNIVLSASSKSIKGCKVCKSVDEVLSKYSDFVVIGGSQIYKEMLPHVEVLYVTLVPSYYEHADTYFDAKYKDDFYLDSSEFKDGLTYQVYKRRK